ncbi:hypothetical protein HRR86_003792 [Exophiala dermatitidis]|nr:hypothetical protein HRR82_003697 [Exophiala dermatitidis]KAJ4627591.1 hypothetical protein HRR86_003792 [Exophiala dermatitidis]
MEPDKGPEVLPTASCSADEATRTEQDSQETEVNVQYRSDKKRQPGQDSGGASPLITLPTSAASRRQSVDALVDLFETKERLSRAPTTCEDRPSTNPAPLLRRRYSNALKSQIQPSSEYWPEQRSLGETPRKRDSLNFDRALTNRLPSLSETPAEVEVAKSADQLAPSGIPRIDVKVSPQSLSIIIPKGIELPIIATIQPAGAFKAQMFGSRAGEEGEASGTSADEMQSQHNVEADLALQAGRPVILDRDNQEIIAGLGLPFLARVSKGRLNVSEASVPPPQSSEVSAQGQVFIPAHQHASEWDSEPLEDPSDHDNQDEHLSEESHGLDANRSSLADLGSGRAADPNTDQADGVPLQAPGPAPIFSPAPEQIALPETPVEHKVPGGFPSKFVPDDSEHAPQIRLHRPSAPGITASLRELIRKSISDSSEPVPTAPPPTPAAAPALTTTSPSEVTGPIAVMVPSATAALPAEVSEKGPNAVIDPSTTGPRAAMDPSATAVLPAEASENPSRAMEATTNAAPATNPAMLGSSTVSIIASSISESTDQQTASSIGSVSRRTRAVRRVRSVLVRKPVLDVIIGRDLAEVIRPELKRRAKLTSATPLQVDGPSDYFPAYSRRQERRRDLQRKRVDEKLATARIHAEAERLRKCPHCQGLTQTKYHRAYHRLQLKRDRPELRMLDRYATGRARVVASRCNCRRTGLFRRGNMARAGDAALTQEALIGEVPAEERSHGRELLGS